MTGDDPQPSPEEQTYQLTPDIRAAEYVLGTLDAAEREEAKAMLAFDPAFASLVRDWECRFGGLHVLADSVEPPPEVWRAIKAQLPEHPQSIPIRQIRLPEIPLRRPVRPFPLKVITLHRQMMRWRTFAAATGVTAAVFGLFIIASNVAPGILPDSLRPKPRVVARLTKDAAPPPQRFVALLQRDAVAPAFILTVDIASRSLTVRRVAAERESGKSYELWLMSTRFPAPRPLGVIGEDNFMQSGSLLPYDPTTIADATFAVSLEPEGGSPSGAPSNIMFTGSLVEAIPPGSPEAQQPTWQPP